MKSSLFSNRVGAIVILLGAALLIVWGNLLPTLGDYQWQLGLNVKIFFAGVPLVFLLANSLYCWLCRVRWFLLTPSLILTILAGLFHCYVMFAFQILQAMRCFDMCPDGKPPVSNPGPGVGFWFPLLGYVLACVGLVIAMKAQRAKKVSTV